MPRFHVIFCLCGYASFLHSSHVARYGGRECRIVGCGYAGETLRYGRFCFVTD